MKNKNKKAIAHVLLLVLVLIALGRNLKRRKKHCRRLLFRKDVDVKELKDAPVHQLPYASHYPRRPSVGW